MNMTIRTDADLKAFLREVGMSVSKREGEYRVAPSPAAFPHMTTSEREDVATYHTDRDDAASSGRATAAELTKTSCVI